MDSISKIDTDYHFGEGEKSLLKREKSINNLLLQLSVIVNSLADWVNEKDKKSEIKR